MGRRYSADRLQGRRTSVTSRWRRNQRPATLTTMTAPLAIRTHVAAGFKEAWLGLRSSDGPPRRMAIVFYLSVLALLFVSLLGGRLFLRNQSERRAERA